FGATFLVLAPEHPLVDAIISDKQRAAVNAYRATVAAKDVVSRKVTDKEKTGVFTGAYGTLPGFTQNLPVWIADYVLMDYGTGAIMAVPGHDERDFAFAKRFNLPIVRVIAGEGDEATTPLTEAYVSDAPTDRVVNSGPFSDVSPAAARAAFTAALEEAETRTGEMVRRKTQYRLYDWCISRQRYWGPPIPIIYCDACGTVPVPEDQLPVVLPDLEDFRPDDSGVSPLARHTDWYHVPCPQCGKRARRETDVSDTFLDSAWYF